MADSEPIPVVDAHQHFWDLERNYYPWLCDAEPIPFRYRDYSAIRHTYLPPDYRRDSVGFNVVKTVHIEAEHDPGNPLAETLWLEELTAEHGLPTAVVAHARLDRDDVEELLTAQGGRPMVRGIRHKPTASASPQEARRGAPGSMDDPRSILPAISPRSRSSSTIPGCLRIAARRGWRAGGADSRQSPVWTISP